MVIKSKSINFPIEVTEFHTEYKITESIVKQYYKDRDYQVYDNVRTLLMQHSRKNQKVKMLSPFSDDNLPKDLVELYKKIKSGDPDLLLVKDNQWYFVEVKIERDGIAKSQIDFLNELSKIYDTRIVIFYAIEPTFNNIDTDLRDRQRKFYDKVLKYKHIQEKNKYKVYWIIARLYSEYKDKMLKKNRLEILSKTINKEKDLIKWFIRKKGKEILEDSNNKKKNNPPKKKKKKKKSLK